MYFQKKAKTTISEEYYQEGISKVNEIEATKFEN
jgi:hypothetical protein